MACRASGKTDRPNRSSDLFFERERARCKTGSEASDVFNFDAAAGDDVCYAEPPGYNELVVPAQCEESEIGVFT